MHGTIIEQNPNQSLKIQTQDRNVFVYKFDEIDKTTKEIPIQNYIGYKPGYKSPVISWAASFLVPGAGQVNNEQFTKGAFIFAGSVLAFGGIYHYSNTQREIRPEYTVSVAAYTCLWIYSMIDAPNTAIKNNKANNLSYQIKPSILNVAMNNKPGLGLNILLNF